MKIEKTILLMILLNFFSTTTYAEENSFEPSKLLGNVSKILDEFKGYNKQLSQSLNENSSGYVHCLL